VIPPSEWPDAPMRFRATMPSSAPGSVDSDSTWSMTKLASAGWFFVSAIPLLQTLPPGALVFDSG